MAVHFNLVLACDLEPDTPDEVVETLEYATKIKKYKYEEVKAFFAENPSPISLDYLADTWREQFADSNYDFEIYHGSGVLEFHEDKLESGNYKLTIRCEVDDLHEFNEIYFPFLEWLAKYTNTEGMGEFIGYFTDGYPHPTLIYFKEKKVCFSKINQEPIEVTQENLWDYYL